MLDTSCIAECLKLLEGVLVFETCTMTASVATLISVPSLLGTGISKSFVAVSSLNHSRRISTDCTLAKLLINEVFSTKICAQCSQI